MNKYTIEQIKKEKIAVICKTKEEGYGLIRSFCEEYFYKTWKDFNFYGSNNFSIVLTYDGINWNNENTHPNYLVNFNLASKYITFEQVNFEEEFVLPKKYVLKEKTMEAPKTFSITGKERHLKAILEDLKELGYVDCNNYPYKGGDTIITTNMNKTSSKELKYFKEMGDYGSSTRDFEINFNLPEDYNKVLEHAKEAINSPFWDEQKIVSVGGKFDVTIKDNKVFHKSDDITLFVKGLVEFYTNLPTKFDKYTCTPKIKFTTTDCQTTQTSLEDWKKVYNELK